MIDRERLGYEPSPSPSRPRLPPQKPALLNVTILESSDPVVRAAAISDGLADSVLQSWLAASLPEALAAVPRCPPDVLIGLLGDSRWQVRSTTVRALAAFKEERPLEQVRALAVSGSLAEKVAAVALLEQWGDLEWLAEQLPKDEPPAQR